MNKILNNCLSPKSKLYLRRLADYIGSFFCFGNLVLLAKNYRTDKWGSHWYAQHYHKHFKSRRKKKLRILEIGVGGYEDPTRGGESLRMWKRYFPNSMIFSIDIYDKTLIEEKRIRIFRGSQADEQFLKKFSAEVGPLDIIVDDGSHLNEHIIFTFKMLFPLLRDGGIYAVEDLQTSYWPKYGGGRRNADLTAPHVGMGFFKSLIDCLNHAEFVRPGYQPTYYDRNIVSMHFYHNLLFIYKGRNDERSNHIVNNVAQDNSVV